MSRANGSRRDVAPGEVILIFDAEGNVVGHELPPLPLTGNGREPEFESAAEFLREHATPQQIEALENRDGGKWLELPLTDLGMAERMVIDHSQELRYVPGVGWHTWDGKRWRPDGDGAVMRNAKRTARKLRLIAASIEDHDHARRWFQHATKSEGDGRLHAMVRLAQSEEAFIARAEDMDKDAFLFNVANGTLDLRTGELREHRRDDNLTKLSPVVYDPDAECPRWLRFLSQVLPEEDLRGYVQRAAGYALTGDIREQVVHIPYGSGANGKSIYINTLTALYGDYAVAADPTTFTLAHKRSVRSDLARLRGARFVPAVEMEAGSRLAEALIKQITGGDPLTVSHLYREEFQFRPVCKIWITVNDLPKVAGEGHAIWRRLQPVPFDVTISKPDRTLGSKLKAELPGILNWALAGCLDWQSNGLGLPGPVVDATAAYRESMDPLQDFMDDRCVLKADAAIGNGELYAAYLTWAKNNEILDPLGRKQFTQSLGRRGPRLINGRFEGRQQRHWRGIRMAPRAS